MASSICGSWTEISWMVLALLTRAMNLFNSYTARIQLQFGLVVGDSLCHRNPRQRQIGKRVNR